MKLLVTFGCEVRIEAAARYGELRNRDTRDAAKAFAIKGVS
jgi:hypothetical protein